MEPATKLRRGTATRRRATGVTVAIAACAFGACVAIVGVACVDGTTPNCSDPGSGCGPDFDGNFPDVAEAGDAPANDAKPADAGSDGNATDAPPSDAPRDAPPG